MALIRGGPAGPDGSGGAYDNTVQTDRAALWHALGGRQGVVKGFAHSGVAGQMALDFTPGAALVGERDATGAASIDRGYLVYAAETTRVLFGPASASARNDAVVAAFVDVESGPVGTGALEVGPHLTVVPGVSGTTTPRTDTQINDYLGRGGWVRIADVPIASGATEIAVSGITVAKTRVTRPRVQSGSVTVTPAAADQATEAAVVFPIPFDSPPRVTVSILTGIGDGANGYKLMCWVKDVTSTGFNAAVRRGNTTPTAVSWIAAEAT